MGEEQLAELERLAKAATPEVWTYQTMEYLEDGWLVCNDVGTVATEMDEESAAFIAAANPAAILALLSAYRRVVRERDAFEDGQHKYQTERDAALRERDEARKALQTYREIFGRSDLQRAGLSLERVNEVWELGKAALAGPSAEGEGE